MDFGRDLASAIASGVSRNLGGGLRRVFCGFDGTLAPVDLWVQISARGLLASNIGFRSPDRCRCARFVCKSTASHVDPNRPLSVHRVLVDLGRHDYGTIDEPCWVHRRLYGFPAP